jgi:hemerythrin-like domain-containing protein
VFEESAIGMVHVHNVILRGLNSIYHQALHILPVDAAAFLEYIKIWCSILEIHHDGEEVSLFPFVDQQTGEPGLMDGNRAQHAGFLAALTALNEYADQVLAGGDGAEGYDGQTVVRLIDDFGPHLREHLEEEIPSLLALAKYGDKLKDIIKVLEDDGKKNMVGPALSTLNVLKPWTILEKTLADKGLSGLAENRAEPVSPRV